jgi:anaerobic selenocysteine-containing dehydrogenase
MMEARKRIGTKIIAVDPRRTELAAVADMHMVIRPGTDGVLAMSLINVMLSRGLYDKDFVRNWTNGPLLVRTDNGDLLTERNLSEQGNPNRYVIWDELTGSPVIYNPATMSYESANATPTLMGTYTLKLADGAKISCKTVLQLLAERAAKYEPKVAEKITWVPAKDIEQAAIWMGTLKPSAFHSLTGVEQNTNSAQTNRAIHVMYALTGNYDVPGGNVIYPFPPPHLNDCEGAEYLPLEQQAKRIGSIERPLAAHVRGYITQYDAYEAILTGKPYPIKGCIGWGGNHLCIGSEALKGREAYRKLEFTAWVELFMTPTAA